MNILEAITTGMNMKRLIGFARTVGKKKFGNQHVPETITWARILSARLVAGLVII